MKFSKKVTIEIEVSMDGVGGSYAVYVDGAFVDHADAVVTADTDQIVGYAWKGRVYDNPESIIAVQAADVERNMRVFMSEFAQ